MSNKSNASGSRRTTWLCPDPSLLLGSPALQQAAAAAGGGGGGSPTELRTEMAGATGGGLFRGVAEELDDWSECEDENGNAYWFNSQTGTTSWVDPGGDRWDAPSSPWLKRK